MHEPERMQDFLKTEVSFMMHLELSGSMYCIYVGLSILLLALSSLVSLSGTFFVIKVEMSCSRAGLSNPVLYPFQPHTPYLLLTASN